MATDTEDFTSVVFLEREEAVEVSPPSPPFDEETAESLNEEEAKTLAGQIQDANRYLEEATVQLDKAKQEENFLEADRLKKSCEEIKTAIVNMEERLKVGVKRHKKILENQKKRKFQSLIQNNEELNAANTRNRSRDRAKEKIKLLVEEHKEDLVGAMEYFKILDSMGSDGFSKISVTMTHDTADVVGHFESVKLVQYELDSLDAETSRLLRELWEFLESGKHLVLTAAANPVGAGASSSHMCIDYVHILFAFYFYVL